jgi:hypothetical protein
MYVAPSGNKEPWPKATSGDPAISSHYLDPSNGSIPSHFPSNLLSHPPRTNVLRPHYLARLLSHLFSSCFSGVEVQTAVEFAKAVEDFLADAFHQNKVLVDAVTGQVMLEQDGYSVVFASEGPPLLGCKGHGKNHPTTVKQAQASSTDAHPRYLLS